MPFTSSADDQTAPADQTFAPGVITPPEPNVFGPFPSGPSSDSVIPGFLQSGALDTGNPVTSFFDTSFAGGSMSPGAWVLAGGAALALLIVLSPSPASGSRRR